MPNRMLALSIVAVAVLSLCGCANTTKAATPYIAHAPSPVGASPVSGGENYKCHKRRGVAGAVGLPNCDNPNNLDAPQ